jgi:hypothetical protein
MTKHRGNDAFFVAPAEAGTHTSWQDWIPAYAESTPRIEKKYSGGMTEREAGTRSLLCLTVERTALAAIYELTQSTELQMNDPVVQYLNLIKVWCRRDE